MQSLIHSHDLGSCSALATGSNASEDTPPTTTSLWPGSKAHNKQNGAGAWSSACGLWRSVSALDTGDPLHFW